MNVIPRVAIIIFCFIFHFIFVFLLSQLIFGHSKPILIKKQMAFVVGLKPDVMH